MQSFWEMVHNDLTKNLPNVELIIWDIIKIILLYIIARVLIRVLNGVIHRLFNLPRVHLDTRRKDTLQSLFDNVVRYTIYFILAIEILSIFHVNIAALLAGAGIVGLAVGFGAQSLIKDILTGLFILFEDQYGVGDMVQINGFTGTVTAIGLRLTRVQASTGEIEIIPNGQVANVTNYSRANSLAILDIGVPYGTDLNQAIALVERVMNELLETEPDIVGEVAVAGVQELRQSDVLIRATAECAPLTHYAIQRKAQLRIREVFDEAGIGVPRPQQTVWLKQQES